MAGSGQNAGDAAGCCSVLQKLGLRPITRCSLAKFYAPAFGAASYTAMSVDVMYPSLVVSVFPKKDITNFLLVSTLLGTGSYIYTREHMKNASEPVRVLYSVTGAVLLSFGSILLWAVMRSIIPPNPAVCMVAGVSSGLAILKVGTNYLEFVDGQIVKK